MSFVAGPAVRKLLKAEVCVKLTVPPDLDRRGQGCAMIFNAPLITRAVLKKWIAIRLDLARSGVQLHT